MKLQEHVSGYANLSKRASQEIMRSFYCILHYVIVSDSSTNIKLYIYSIAYNHMKIFVGLSSTQYQSQTWVAIIPLPAQAKLIPAKSRATKVPSLEN